MRNVRKSVSIIVTMVIAILSFTIRTEAANGITPNFPSVKLSPYVEQEQETLENNSESKENNDNVTVLPATTEYVENSISGAVEKLIEDSIRSVADDEKQNEEIENKEKEDVKDIKKITIQLGWRVMLEEDAKYYASSKDFGSGKIGTASNKSIPKDKIVTINGVSNLKENRQIKSSSYISYKELLLKKTVTDEEEKKLSYIYLTKKIGFNKYYMIHICTADTDLGWVSIDDVIFID